MTTSTTTATRSATWPLEETVAEHHDYTTLTVVNKDKMQKFWTFGTSGQSDSIGSVVAGLVGVIVVVHCAEVLATVNL